MRASLPSAGLTTSCYSCYLLLATAPTYLLLATAATAYLLLLTTFSLSNNRPSSGVSSITPPAFNLLRPSTNACSYSPRLLLAPNVIHRIISKLPNIAPILFPPFLSSIIAPPALISYDPQLSLLASCPKCNTSTYEYPIGSSLNCPMLSIDQSIITLTLISLAKDIIIHQICSGEIPQIMNENIDN